ncbi:MAG: glycosyltransferase family 9 protein [Terriglobia bacterium]
MSETTRTAAVQTELLARLPSGAAVLVVRLRSMGDTILMTPALRVLHDWRPDLRVSVLVEHPWNELLEGNPAVHAVLPLRGKLLAAWRVRRARFDAVVNLHGGPTSAFLTRWSRASLRAGFAHFRHPGAYTAHIPTAQEILGTGRPVHTAEQIASAFFWLGVPPTEIPPAELFPSDAARERVQARLRSMGVEEDEGYAVIHPTAVYASKQWSALGFADVGQYLESMFGLRAVYVCGNGDKERETLDQMERHGRRSIVSAQGWPLREVVALTAGARVFVGNDSGPAHIAAAVRIPVLVIFGSSHATVWKPWKAVDSAVVQNYFDCNPCPGDRCLVYEEPRCILSISVEEVKVCLDALLRTPTRLRK